MYCKDFSKAGYLSVEKKPDYVSVNMMHSYYILWCVPSYLCNFTRVDGVHTYGTRHIATSYVLPEIKSGKRVLCTMGPDCEMGCQLD